MDDPDTLYANVDGNDLHDIAVYLERELDRFVKGNPWRHATPRVVNQVHQPDSTLAPGDLPGWDLGINLPLPGPDATEAALHDLLALVEFLRA